MTERTGEVKDTASWMAGCRAAMIGLSLDVYANYWLTEAAREKHLDYTSSVSPWENACLSLRNRFFYEEIRAYFVENPDAVLVNIGAGYSSYSFLMDDSRRYFEADCAENIDKKQAKIEILQEQGLLPKRDITFYAVDLADLSQVESLFEAIKAFVGDKKCFILFEGLVYYLPEESTEKLLELSSEIQASGSKIGVVSWDPGTTDLPVYKRFQNYFRRTEGGEPPEFICHDPAWLKSRPGYQQVISTGYPELSGRFQMEEPLKPEDDVFWERITILEKN